MSFAPPPRKRAAQDSHEHPSKPKRRSRKPRKHNDPSPPKTKSEQPAQTNKQQQHRHHHRQHQPETVQSSHFYSYQPDSTEWTRSDPQPSTSKLPATLRLLTYNTWSSSPTHTQSQTKALLSILDESKADVIALQEVSKSFESNLRKERWVQSEWSMTSLEEYWRCAGKDGNGKGKKEGEREGCVVLVKSKLIAQGSSVGVLKFRRANNEQAKAAVVVKLVDGDGAEKLRLLTSHYSSLPQNATLRRMQYQASLSQLSVTPRAVHSVLLADFNASSSSEFDLFRSTLIDSCPSPATPSSAATADRSDDSAFRSNPTFGHLYPLVTPHSKPRKPRRIDRIFATKGTKTSQYTEVGGDAIEGERDRLGKDGKRFPSDHLGIMVRVHID